ncbi:hypothetical protein ODQ68_22600, partial [Escherichia coli]|nr:hypothetical protein [Escherichia coli]
MSVARVKFQAIHIPQNMHFFNLAPIFRYRDFFRKRLVRTVLIFTESSDQLSRATDRVPGLPASPEY